MIRAFESLGLMGSGAGREARAKREREAKEEAEKQEADMVAKLAMLHIQPLGTEEGGHPGLLDVHEEARLLLVLHICNQEMRSFVAQLATQQAAGLDLESVRAGDAFLRKLGEPGPKATQEMVDASMWVEFFRFVRLPRWNIDLETDTVMVAQNLMILRSNEGSRTPLYTGSLVRFYKQLCRAYPQKAFEVPLRQDLVLLYFVATCLLDKNGAEVVRKSDHIGPAIAAYQKVVNRPGLAEKRHHVSHTDVLADFMAVLAKCSPNVCTPRKTQDEQLDLANVRITWGNLIRLLNCHLPRYWTKPVDRDVDLLTLPSPEPEPTSAEPSSTTTTIPTVGETKTETTGEEEEGSAGEAAEEEGSATEEGVEEDRPLPPLPASATQVEEAAATATAAEEVIEVTMPSASAPSTTATGVKPADRRIQMARSSMVATKKITAECMYHTHGQTIGAQALCPQQCIQSRLGLEAKPATQRTASCAPLQCIATRIGAPMQDNTGKLVMSAIIATVTPQTPVARRLILERYGGLDSEQAASVVPIKSTLDWSNAINTLKRVEARNTGVRLMGEGIGEVAKICGLQQAPIGEQIACYATLYGATNPVDAFIQNGWARTAKIDADLKQFVRENPVVPLRTLQVIATAAMAVKN